MARDSVEAFLTTSEEQEVIQAIRKAENQTTGEIRVHIERTSKGDIEKRALEVFGILKMHNTERHNAVLIYVAVDDHGFAIYGDKGINDVVETDFWDSTKNKIESHFKAHRFKDGLVAGILEAGNQLKAHFPATSANDNELPNTISRV